MQWSMAKLSNNNCIQKSAEQAGYGDDFGVMKFLFAAKAAPTVFVAR